MSTYTKNLNLFKYDVTADEKVPFSITDALNNNWDIIDEKCNGGGLEICDIGMSLYVDETKGLRRYLNGQIVAINTNTQAFLNRLKDITTLHPSLLCTEDEWQTAKTMSAFGQVGKFVFNYSGDEIVSVRIPAIVNVQGLFDLQNLGMTVGAGLPNITGFSRLRASILNSTENDGALSVNMGVGSTSNAATSSGSSKAGDNLDFNASNSNPIYGNSDTVQQEAIQYPYFIQIATGSETENNIVNEIELNNPYSLFDSKYSDHELNNLSWLKSEGQWNAKAVYTEAYDKLLKVYNGTETINGLSVKLSTEAYTDYDFVLNTAEETFRLPIKVKLASGKTIVGNGMTVGLTDGKSTYGLVSRLTGGIDRLSAYGNSYGLGIGSNVTGNNEPPNLIAYGVTTDPTKSGIETSDSELYLYFYVGETVQNANLIDAGRIGEQLANKVDINSKVIDGQWVNKISKLSSELSQGLYEVDLKTSGYLPNDNYCYEVFIYGYCYRATSNATNVFVYSDILGNDSAQSFMSVKASSSNNAIVVPVNKKIYIKLTSALTDGGITSMGYRRIGTNQ